MRSGGDQADREELREKAAGKKLASKRGACDKSARMAAIPRFSVIARLTRRCFSLETP
jgi:hypothetical protein